MLYRGDVALIDLGSAVEFGVPIVEYTQLYSLDASVLVALTKFDINCLVTALIQCCEPHFEVKARGQSQLFEALQSSTHPFESSCLGILRCNSFMEAIELWQAQVVDRGYESRDREISLGK